MEEFIQKLKKSKTVAVITGAGISAESGIPTFRGEGGYWKSHRAEELATPGAFAKDPKLVTEWYEMRMQKCFESDPNPGHFVIAEFEKIFPNFLLITQNVDGLHTRAGSKKIIELHGNIYRFRCTKCSNKIQFDKPTTENPIICKSCDSIMRPDILWFGESYDLKVLSPAIHFAKSSEIIFVIGTSGQVTVPMQIAMEGISRGAYSIEINLDKSTIHDSINISFQEKSGVILPKILELLKK